MQTFITNTKHKKWLDLCENYRLKIYYNNSHPHHHHAQLGYKIIHTASLVKLKSQNATCVSSLALAYWILYLSLFQCCVFLKDDYCALLMEAQ